MPMHIGSTGIDKVYVGSQAADKVYLGSTEVWSNVQPIAFRAANGTTGISNTLSSMPAHSPGEFLLMYASANFNTTITVPSGWTTALSSPNASNSYVWAYKFASSSSETSGTWTNAQLLVCATYQNVAGVGSVHVGLSGNFTGPGNISFGPITSLTVNNGTSWIACGIVIRSSAAFGTSTIPMRGTAVETSNNTRAGLFDTGAGRTSWGLGAGSVQYSGSGAYRSNAIELLAAT